MARKRVAKLLRQTIAAQASYRCGYCLTPQSVTAMPMHVEHIISVAAGGTTAEDNLWLACPLCNGYKGARTQAIDPLSGETVGLFNPREQTWSDHFAWSQDGIQIIGITPCGRATVSVLRLNNNYLVTARRRWVLAGWHPPDE
jgi:hypothetical protein